MPQYIIYFHQQWVGEHSEEWFHSRGPLARAVMEEMKAAGVHVFSGGLDEDRDAVITADATSGTLRISQGPKSSPDHYLGGLAVIDVPDEQEAKMWAGKVAEACGWPQEMRLIV